MRYVCVFICFLLWLIFTLLLSSTVIGLVISVSDEWRINSVWHSITVIPDCHRFIVFLPKKSTIGSKNPIMGILEENRTFISSRPGCILCRLDEMESWAYLDDLLP